MDMKKFTEKSALALQTAQSVAREYGNQEIAQIHLFYALITAEEGLIPQLLQKMEKDVAHIAVMTEKELANLPKVSGGEQYLASALALAIEEGERQSKKMGDSFLSVEHLFYGVLEKADGVLK